MVRSTCNGSAIVRGGTLIDTGDGSIDRFVKAASTLFARPRFGPAALVGGLAVAGR